MRDARVEWWYVSGHLTDDDARRYGFHVAAFRVDRDDDRTDSAPGSYRVDAAIVDLSTGRYRSSVRIVSPGPWSWWSRDDLDLRLGSARMRMTSTGEYRITASCEDAGIDLELTAQRDEIAHGDQGRIRMGTAGESSYTSITRLRTTGTVHLEAIARRVSGAAWIDHQEGGADLVAGTAWDWFSIRLEDGTDLMAYLFTDGSRIATLVAPDGSAQRVEIACTPSGGWLSPHTGITYPSGWVIRLPEGDTVLTVLPDLPDQEVRLAGGREGAYWEGSCSVSGIHRGRQVRGQAYVELAGYRQNSLPSGSV